MKHRNPLAVVLLSIVTLGIYDLYWLVKTKTVLNQTTSYHTPSIWLLVAPVPGLLLGYIGLIGSSSLKTTTNAYGQTQLSNGTHPGIFLIFLAITFIAILIAMAISIFWFFRFSKAINQYTNGKMSTAVTFLVLWLIHLIGVALIQDTFNDMQGAPAIAGVPIQNPQPLMAQPAVTTSYSSPPAQVMTNNMPPQVSQSPQMPGSNPVVTQNIPNQDNQPQPPAPTS